MSISRRDFMKLVGISVSSLALAGCRIPLPVTCYAPLVPTSLPSTARDRLRLCWTSFGRLAQKTQDESSRSVTDNTFGQQLQVDHRLALDEIVATGELTPPVADLVDEAFGAAVYHVWRSNAMITCYAPMIVDYAPVSAGVLVQQSALLTELGGEGAIDPDTLAKARLALEHDMAYYALADQEVDRLVERLVAEWQSQGQPFPPFEDLELQITPDAKTAARYILSLLTNK